MNQMPKPRVAALVELRTVICGLVVVAWASEIMVAWPGPPALRVPAGILLGLVVPGWIFSYALMPDAKSLGRARIILAVASSVAISLFVGLGLGISTGAVGRLPAAGILTAISTIAGGVALRRIGPVPTRRVPALRRPSGGQALFAGTVGVALLALVVLAGKLFSLNTEVANYTALSVVRSHGRPLATIENHEGGVRSYRWAVGGANGMVLQSGSVRLKRGETATFSFKTPLARMRISLFLGTNSQTYRTVVYDRAAPG